jgi:tetratricopeptide (TPR) repeat protein
VEFENSLNFCVAQVRNALRDDAHAPRFVETLRGRGYRFVAPVRRIASGAERGPLLQAAERPERRSRPRVAWLSGAAAVLISLSVLQAWPQRITVTSESPVAPAAPSPALVKGLYHAGGGLADLPEAIRWLERAVRDAPADTRARVALAGVYYRAAEAQVRTGRDVFPRARAVAAEAIEREPANAKARLWHAVARVYGDWDWSGGGDELRRAAALDPASVQGQRELAAYLSATGDDVGALAAIEAARRLDPVCLAVTADRALYLYRARRFDDAAAAWREILDVRDDAAPHEGLFELHRVRGRHEQAKAEALRVMTLVGAPAASLDGLSRRPPAQAVRGFLSGALAHLARPGTGAGPERLAVLRAALGEHGPALGLLEKACQDHSPGLPRTLRDPAFDALRPAARFQRVRACVGLPAQPSPPLI